MDDPVRAFYDDLADDYHLLFADWSVSVRFQADVLGRLIVGELGARRGDILDCACGIGTQAIGLALLGYRVRATDLSLRAIDRLRRESASLGVTIESSVADLRELVEQVSGAFDAVLACDNALPHLLTDADLNRAVANMAAKLRPGGLFLTSIRDYDRLGQERPQTAEPRVFDGPHGRRIAFQVWDWAADGDRYRVHQFLVRQLDNAWQTDHVTAEYRALSRDELAAAAGRAGLVQLRWHEPETSGYYQPILTARRPA